MPLRTKILASVLLFSGALAVTSAPVHGQAATPGQPGANASNATVQQPADGVLTRTLLAMRIRFLVENWSLGRDASHQQRLIAAYDTLKKYRPDVAKSTLEFVFQPTVETVPDEITLRRAVEALEFFYPRPTQTAPLSEAKALAERLPPLSYNVFRSFGDQLGAEEVVTGAGVSFEQALIEGATAYLLDRARVELARSGLQIIHRRFNDQELKWLFESTVAMGGSSSDLNQADPRLFLAAFQASLASDLNNLPTRLVTKLQETKKYPDVPDEYWQLSRSALELVADVQRGTHPLLALSTFAGKPAEGDHALKRRLFELHVVSSALYAGLARAEGQTLAASGILESLDGRRLFAAFLYDACTKSTSCVKLSPEDWTRLESRLVALRQTLDEIVVEVNRLRTSFNEVRASNPEQAALIYADYVSVVTRAVRLLFDDPALMGNEDVRKALDHVESLLSIREALIRRDYTQAMTLTLPYLEKLVPSSTLQKSGPLLAAATTLASASSSDQVYQTLVVYAAPPGSFKARRTVQPVRVEGRRGRALHLSLSAYPGFSGGGEWVGDDRGGHLGLSIPIGIELTGALKSPVVSSLGVMLSPVNLGTYADYRFGTSETEELPAYTLAQVFAPSGYLTLGISQDFPMTLGFGGGYVPEFRNVSGQATRGAWRLSGFLAVDVPLWIF